IPPHRGRPSASPARGSRYRRAGVRAPGRQAARCRSWYRRGWSVPAPSSVSAFPLAFRYEVHHTACLADGKHYIAFLSVLTTHIKKLQQNTVFTKNSEIGSEHDYLAALGETVREARARRGISRQPLTPH